MIESSPLVPFTLSLNYCEQKMSGWMRRMATESSLLPQYRVRHRLIGTAALLAVAAVVLPWLFDTAPRGNDALMQGEIRVNGPDASVVLTKPVLTLAQETVAHPASPVSVVPPSTHTPSATDLHQPAGTLKTLADVVQVPGGITQAPTSATQVAAKPVAPITPFMQQANMGQLNAVTKPVAKNGHMSLPNSTASTRENTSLKASVRSKVVSAQGQFAVQLGVFSQLKNVTELRQHLQANGIASYVDTMPSGARRVRCGPFKTRAEAADALASLRLLDVAATIVPAGR
jgi:DedD protein